MYVACPPLSWKINDLHLKETRKISPSGSRTVLRKSRMCSRSPWFLCELAGGRGEGGLSLGELSHPSLSCWSFSSGSLQPLGSDELIHAGPHMFPTLPSSWSILGLGFAAQDIRSLLQSCRFPSRPSHPRLSPSWVRNPSQNLKTRCFLPEKIDTPSSLCLLSGDSAGPHRGVRIQADDPWHKSYTGRFETWQFLLLQSVLWVVYLYLVWLHLLFTFGTQVPRIGLVAVFDSYHAHLWPMQDSSVTAGSLQFAALGWRPSLTTFYGLEWVT